MIYKKEPAKKILILSLSYHPNIGGLETHLEDLCRYLVDEKKQVYVLTYQPIVTKTDGRSYEKKGKFEIRRINWFGKGFFLKLVHHPLLEFLYLFFPLFILGFFLLRKRGNFSVIHAQGIIAGAAGVFLGKLFKKKVVISTHAVYHFPKGGFYTSFSRYILENADQVLTLSKKAKEEIVLLGISEEKVKVFTYWINQKIFAPTEKEVAKKKMGWEKKFVVLFVGRLIVEKGVKELLEAASITDKNIHWAIAGDGPLGDLVRERSKENEKILFLGRFDNTKLPLVYNAADLLVVPSTHDEGFGRVILEALACGTPVVAANRGGIPEAMDDTVGKLIQITPTNIRVAVELFYKSRKVLEEKRKNAIEYSKKRYSEENADLIKQSYE